MALMSHSFYVVFFFGNEHKNKDIDQKDIVNVITMLHANKLKVCKNVMQCHSFSPDLFFYYLSDFIMIIWTNK
jgi:hypothetical protein